MGLFVSETLQGTVSLPMLDTVPEATVKAALKAPEAEREWVLLELLAPPSSLDVIDRMTVDYLRLVIKDWEVASDISITDLIRVVRIIGVPKQREAMASDLIGKGIRLRDFPSDRCNWSDLMLIIRNLDVHSALYIQTYPDRAHWDRTNMLLASIDDRLHWLQWAKTANGRKGRNRPKPIPRPGYMTEQREGAKVKAAPLSEVRSKFAKRYATAANAAIDPKKTLTAGLGRRLPVQQPPKAVDRITQIANAFHGRR